MIDIEDGDIKMGWFWLVMIAGMLMWAAASITVWELFLRSWLL